MTKVIKPMVMVVLFLSLFVGSREKAYPQSGTFWTLSRPTFSDDLKTPVKCQAVPVSDHRDIVVNDNIFRSEMTPSQHYFLALDATHIRWTGVSGYQVRMAAFARNDELHPVQEFNLNCGITAGALDDNVQANFTLKKGTLEEHISIPFPLHSDKRLLEQDAESDKESSKLLSFTAGNRETKISNIALKSEAQQGIVIDELSLEGPDGYCANCLKIDFEARDCKHLIGKLYPNGAFKLPICLKPQENPDEWPSLSRLRIGHSADNFFVLVSYETYYGGLVHSNEVHVPVQVQLQPRVADLVLVALAGVLIGIVVRVLLWYLSPSRSVSKNLKKDLALQVVGAFLWIFFVHLFLLVSAWNDKPVEVWGTKMYTWLLLPCFLATVLAGGGPPLQDFVKQIGIKKFGLGGE